jgi:hypothetical protein
MRKLFLLSALALAGTAVAADVSFDGTLEAEYGTYLDKDFVVDNRANQDLGINMNVALDENVSAIASFSTQSTYVGGDSLVAASQFRHRYSSTEMGDDANRWTAVNFDGILFKWQIQRNAAFVFGDLTYSAGAFNYYYWRNTRDYASIITDQGLRGLGFELEGGRVYLGASDNNDKSAVLFASYPLAIIDRTDNKLVLTPSFDAIKGGGRDHRYTAGAEIEYTRSYTMLNYGLRGAVGTRPFHGDNTYTFLVEPSMNYGKFSLASSAYTAVLADGDSTAAAQTYVPDERMVYVEPSISLHPKFALGLSGEWHDPDSETNDDEYTVYSPTGYLYPTAGMEIVFWTGYSVYHAAPNLFSFGISSKVEF